jgi:ABC-type uncharacterized transport system permease subunit
MKFLKAVFWEFVQNFPLIGSFFLTLQFWQAGQWAAAVVLSLVGSALGAGVIALTESNIVAGHREPLSVVITNSIVIALLMLGVTIYLSASSGSWAVDVLIGSLAGIGLGIAQSLAAREPIGWRHCVALAVGFSLALVGIRVVLSLGLPLLFNILGVTAVATIIISVIDYGPMSFNTRSP